MDTQIVISKMQSFPPHTNVFMTDIIRMGTQIGVRGGERVMLMQNNHATAEVRGLCIAFEGTGEWFEIEFSNGSPEEPEDDHTDDICPCGDPDCSRPFGHSELG